MQIILSQHCQDQMVKRGVNELEIKETIEQNEWQKVKFNRLEAEREYLFNSTWNNKFYQFKKINPVFVKEHAIVIVITVYAFYYN